MFKPVFSVWLSDGIFQPLKGNLLTYNYNREDYVSDMLSNLNGAYTTYSGYIPSLSQSLGFYPYMERAKSSYPIDQQNVGRFQVNEFSLSLGDDETEYVDALDFYEDGKWTAERFVYQQMRLLQLSWDNQVVFQEAINAARFEDIWITQRKYINPEDWDTDITSMGQVTITQEVSEVPVAYQTGLSMPYETKFPNLANPNLKALKNQLKISACGAQITQKTNIKKVRLKRSLDSFLTVQGERPHLIPSAIIPSPEGIADFALRLVNLTEFLALAADTWSTSYDYDVQIGTNSNGGPIYATYTYTSTATTDGPYTVNGTTSSTYSDLSNSIWSQFGTDNRDVFVAAYERSFATRTCWGSVTYSASTTEPGVTYEDFTIYYATGTVGPNQGGFNSSDDALFAAQYVAIEKKEGYAGQSSKVPFIPNLTVFNNLVANVIDQQISNYGAVIKTNMDSGMLTEFDCFVTVTEVMRSWTSFLRHEVTPFNPFLPNETLTAHRGRMFQIGWLDDETGEFRAGQAADCEINFLELDDWVIPEVVQPEANDPVFTNYIWDDFQITIDGDTFLLQDGSDAPLYPTFKGAFVFDTHLKKWGRYVGDYKRLLDYRAINNYKPGEQSYSKFGIFGGIVDATGKMRLFNDFPEDSYIKYGKIGYYRQGMTSVEEVQVHHRIPVSGILEIESSLEGKVINAGLNVATSFNAKDSWQQNGGFSGRWHNVVIKGQFDISYLEFRGSRQGKR